MKSYERWYSHRLEQDIGVARWGTHGVPVLVFPTAGGDAEEIERRGVVDACSGLLAAGRIKLYSLDSVAGAAMVNYEGSPHYRMALMNRFHETVREEVLPAMRADSGGFGGRVIAAGASIGAFNAVATVCRYPDQFGAAIGMSGSYDLQPFYEGQFSDALYFASPLHFLPGLDGWGLDALRSCFLVLASGSGAYEDVGQSWRMSEVLSSKGVPNRVDDWGQHYEHDWPTWLDMLPLYLDDLAP